MPVQQWRTLVFVTFTTYGTWLHGSEKGSVDYLNNVLHTDYLTPNKKLLEYRTSHLNHPPYTMDDHARAIVRDTLEEVAAHRNWIIYAANVLSNHLHILLDADGAKPEKVMNDLKSYATRNLRRHFLVDPRRTIWTRHGSTIWVNEPTQARRIYRYILEKQPNADFIIQRGN